MVRALCAEPWVPPTERAGSEGSFMLWKSCIGLPSQPKLASSLPIKRPTYCRLTVRRQNRKTAPVARRKCTPSVACGDVSPRESVSRNFQSSADSLQISFACHPGGGGLLSASPCANLSCSFYRGAKTSPSGGSTAVGGDRGAFPRAAGAVVWFSPPEGRVACFPTGESPVVKVFYKLAAEPPSTTLSGKAAVKP